MADEDLRLPIERRVVAIFADQHLGALYERLARNVFASDYLFADDTPVPVLDPGRGRTKTGRLWSTPASKERGGGPEPPAAVYVLRRTAEPNVRPRISSG